METQCTCCGFLWFGSGGGGERKPGGKRGATAGGKAIVKRVSKEHLLSYNSGEDSAADAKAGARGAPAANCTSQYRPPCSDAARAAAVSTGSSNARRHAPPVEDPPPTPPTPQSQPQLQLRASMVLPLLEGAVKETTHEFRSLDVHGNKMVNEYVWKGKIGTGSYGKVVLYQSQKDEKLYAIKIFHKSRLNKLRVSPTETAMMDVLREVAIMKRLDHPNVVKLYEIIDDPESDNFYLVLEYMEHNRIFEGCGPPGGIGEAVARKYFRDVVAGLSYLHDQAKVIHGDIKPENLLLGNGDFQGPKIKICDFGVSRAFEGDNDELHRSPGTPVYTAPECCSGLYNYRGRPADVWALGCTLYCMIFGRYPFVGDGTFSSIYDEIVKQPVFIPEGINPDLADLLRGLLCKDVMNRLSLTAVATHPWMSRPFGQVQESEYPTYELTYHPFPGGHRRHSFENRSMELKSVVQ